MGTSEVIACSLNRDELADRREAWYRLAAGSFDDRRLTDRGQQLVFRRDPGVEEALHELAKLERECCAFADWNLSVSDGQIVLEVTGRSDEGIAAVQAMFRSLAG